jgi:hypothetical protein
LAKTILAIAELPNLANWATVAGSVQVEATWLASRD